MTGAKTGAKRSLPLVCLHDGELRILIASNLGSQSNPAWYYNLVANPQVLVSEKNKHSGYTARHAAPDEREKYWKEALQLYPGYANYQERAGGRIIPILVLEPDASTG
jgi:deazaflavin-dependent oxidoreductase (nitroreductase family)